MTFPREFKYDPKVSYNIPPVPFSHGVEYRDEIRYALTKFTIAVSETESFDVRVEDIFYNYPIKFNKLQEAKTWLQGSNMKYWQNQLNFAVYCASAGCGVSWKDHLNRPTLPLILGLFRFHVYFQTRKILADMKCPLPGDDDFNPINNHISTGTYYRICREFNVRSTADFRCRLGSKSGLGRMYTREFGKLVESSDVRMLGWKQLPQYFQYIQQDNTNGWVNFIPLKGKGFTKAGIQRINETIRAYVYCVLGAQAQTRNVIVGNTSTAFDAQKQFLSLFRDAI